MYIYIGLVILVILWMMAEFTPYIGMNAATTIHDRLLQNLRYLYEKMKTKPIGQIGPMYKGMLNELDKHSFTQLANRGYTEVVRSKREPSRGTSKLIDILTQTRLHISGTVLDLCAGRGGWDVAIAPIPSVTEIYSYTLGPGPGHVGHEPYTEKTFPGREKVHQYYADCTTLPPIPCNWILFDGGESHPKYEKEADRFYRLLRGCVERHITNPNIGFIWKILTPDYEPVLEFLKKVQNYTGKGGYVRSTCSKPTNCELYFVSCNRRSLESDFRRLMLNVAERAIAGRKVTLKRVDSDTLVRGEVIRTGPPILEPLDMSRSIKELGNPLNEAGRTFAQWESLGVYNFGVTGSSQYRINSVAANIVRQLAPSLPDMASWQVTDTTPDGFMQVFRAKVDTSPVENSPYDHVQDVIYDEFFRSMRRKGFVLREKSWEEVVSQANPQGAPALFHHDAVNVGEYLNTPGWQERCDQVRKSLDQGVPISGIYSTMGKREKKKTRGSRMVAYLPIPMRLVESKIMGNLINLTHAEYNPYGVGGLGLQDLGECIRSRWKGAGVSSDVGGFDTRVSLKDKSRMAAGLELLAENDALKHSIKQLYRLYAHPHILIPMPDQHFVRSELLKGRGQMMSGSNPTYAENTTHKTLKSFLQMMVVDKVDLNNDEAIRAFVRLYLDPTNSPWSGVISGDDEAIFSDYRRCAALANTGELLNTIGYPRKNLAATAIAPIATSIPEIEFCSHHFEPISFYDADTGAKEWRMMPTRDVAEIVAKSCIWLGNTGNALDEAAWCSNQGNNLLVCYPHLRTVRALGCAYKSLAHPNLGLTDRGATFFKKPWMREGDILNVINDCLFGCSTHYPRPGFRVHSFSHLGYLPIPREKPYDPHVVDPARTAWRKRLEWLVRRTMQEYRLEGQFDFLYLWRRPKNHL